MKAILTCCVCSSSQEVDSSLTVRGDDLETWWLLRRRQTCTECYRHTCWKAMEGDTVCFSDLGHPGACVPWRDEYGQSDVASAPVKDLWAGWDRATHASAP